MFAVIDYFFYRVFFITKKYKEEGDAKWSSLLFTGLYLSLFIIGFFSMIGVIYDNIVSQQLIKNPLFIWMSTGIVFAILSGIRYYRFVDIVKIEVRFNSLHQMKQTLIDVFIIFALFAIPIYIFVFYRIYVYGIIL